MAILTDKLLRLATFKKISAFGRQLGRISTFKARPHFCPQVIGLKNYSYGFMISDIEKVISQDLHRIDCDEADECYLFHRSISLHREPSNPVVRISEDGIVA